MSLLALPLPAGVRLLSGSRRERVAILGALVASQWAALAAFALVVRHNGFLFYQGGDETFYWTNAWALSGWHLPPSAVGYGWSYLLSPFALASGPNFVAALPAIVVAQSVLLLPLALLLVYCLASRIGGHRLGYLAATAWVAAPYLLIPFVDSRYHARYVEQFLPQALGLTGLADFPSLVALLACAVLCFRVLDHRDWRDAALAGIVGGFALGLKPANAVFLLGPLLAFAVARVWRQALVFGLALLPALLTLALWKQRGLGQLPIFAEPGARMAAGQLGGAPVLADPFSRYVHLDWGKLSSNFTALREYFWSERLLEYLPLAGTLAVARRAPAKALLLLGWLAGFVLIKGGAPYANVDSGSFLRFLMPSFPAYLVLAASIPLLLPGLRTSGARPAPPPVAPGRGTLGAAVALLAALPLVLVAAPPELVSPTAIQYFDGGVFVGVAGGFDLRADRRTGAVALAWNPRRVRPTNVFYRVFRAPSNERAPDPTLPAAVDGIRCLPHGKGAIHCLLQMQLVGTTDDAHWQDKAPPGRWSYRIGYSANWLDDPGYGDVLMLSEPTRVTVPG